MNVKEKPNKHVKKWLILTELKYWSYANLMLPTKWWKLYFAPQVHFATSSSVFIIGVKLLFSFFLSLLIFNFFQGWQQIKLCSYVQYRNIWIILIRTHTFQKIVFVDFNESPLKMMKNAFYFMLKALLFLQIFTFLYWLFGYVEKRLDKKATVNFKIYDVTDYTTINCNTHIA